MKISIITPCYNAAKTIVRTMDSVLAQTVSPFEYIIIDGGSTDGTVEIAKSHPAVTYVISEKDKGIADAFNKGIALSSGDAIGIINSDDWYEPEAIEKATAGLADSSVGVFHGALQYWNGSERYACFYPNIQMITKEMTVNHPTVFIKKCIYETYGYFDDSYRYAMDYELMLRLWIRNVKFVHDNTVIANMALSGISDEHWIAAYREVARAKANLLGETITAWKYWMWQVGRTATRKALLRAGLYGVVRTWRTHFSVMKKSK